MMKLRVLPSPEVAQGAHAKPTPALMLSPGDQVWCRLDGGSPQVSPRVESSTVVLTGASREQVGGLLDLRDGDPIQLYATPAMFEHLTQALPLLPVLQQFCGVQWHLIPIGGEQREADFTIEHWPTLTFTALAPDHASASERIALAVRDEISGARLFVGQGDSLDGSAFEWMREADCVVIETAHRQGMLERLAGLPAARKLLLNANGTSRAWLAERGIECADAPLDIQL